MTRAQCPNQAALLDFVDESLSPEQVGRILTHLQGCSSCAEQVVALRELMSDVAAPLDGVDALDVDAHVASVMARLDEAPPSVVRVVPRLWLGIGAALAAAAALALLLRDPEQLVPNVAIATTSQSEPVPVALGPRAAERVSEWTARGSANEASLARDVGVQLYVDTPPLAALQAGQTIAARAAFTAGLRNVSSSTAYLLLFGIDSQQEVHWIAPLFTQAGSDPQATPIPPGPKERLLNSAVVFDDLPPGPFTLITLLTREPTRVSRVEELAPAERSVEHLKLLFPQAQIQSLALSVSR